MDFVVEAQAIELRLGEKKIYKNLTLAIPRKGCTVLLGPSGTGKSTLLRLLSGQLLSHGSLQLSGQLTIDGSDATKVMRGAAPSLVEQKADLLMANVWEALVGEWSRRGELTQLQQKAQLAQILENWGQAELLNHISQPMLSLASEQRKRVAIVRKALRKAPLLMIDEPTANMKPEDAERVVHLVKKISLERPVLVVTHHLKQAREMADHIVLLASGMTQEQASAEVFFASPGTESGRQFLLTGSCPEMPMDAQEDVPESMEELAAVEGKPALELLADAQDLSVTGVLASASNSDLDSEILPRANLPQLTPADNVLAAVPVKENKTANVDSTLSLSSALSSFSQAVKQEEQEQQALSDIQELVSDGSQLIRPATVPVPRSQLPLIRGRGPRGLTWILEGLLAGTPLPGVLAQRESDLSDLRDAGITHLISLTETPFPAEIAAPYGISCSALPMPDMMCPTLEAAIALCQWMDELVAAGHCIAVHCRAGLGRTGTILCIYWIWRSSTVVSSIQAIQFIRSKNAGMIQSVSQEAFIDNFIEYCFNSPRQLVCRS